MPKVKISPSEFHHVDFHVICCVIRTTKFDHPFACYKYWNARNFYTSSLKKFLRAGSFTGSPSKRSSKSFQIINSLDQRKFLSSIHVAFWAPTQPNLSFAGFSNKFSQKIFCRDFLDRYLFTEFAGPKKRLFLCLPRPVSRSVLTAQANVETCIWIRIKTSFTK